MNYGPCSAILHPSQKASKHYTGDLLNISLDKKKQRTKQTPHLHNKASVRSSMCKDTVGFKKKAGLSSLPPSVHTGRRKQLSAMLAIFGLRKLKVNQSRNQRKNSLFYMYFHTTQGKRTFSVCLQSVD